MAEFKVRYNGTKRVTVENDTEMGARKTLGKVPGVKTINSVVKKKVPKS